MKWPAVVFLLSGGPLRGHFLITHHFIASLETFFHSSIIKGLVIVSHRENVPAFCSEKEATTLILAIAFPQLSA
jgi:hypothetical protein